MRARSRNGSRSEDNFHQIRFVRIEPLKPLRAIFERRNRSDERFYFDGAAGQKLNGLGIFPGGGAGALDANLASHCFLQWQRHFRGDVSNQSNGSTFAHGMDGGADGGINADSFNSNVDACAVCAAEDLGNKFVARGM